jgi:hypothetical protein
MHVKCFCASNLFDLEQRDCIPGNPAFLDILFRHNDVVQEAAEGLIGPGIYAAFFDFGLIYIGSFCGQKSNPYAGNLVDARWNKHIGTFTSRGRKVSLSPKALFAVKAFNNRLGQGFQEANDEAVCRDRGMQATFNRLRFAAQHWSAFSELDALVLQKFLFVYVRLEQADMPSLTPARVRILVRAAEDALVACLRPCCNAKIKGEDLSSPHGPDEVVQSIETVLRAQVQAACTADPDASDATVDDWPTVRPAGPARSQRCPASAIRESEEPEAPPFFDSIQGCARDLVDALIERLDGPPPNAANSYEVHFTNTNGGDLRVRAQPALRPARNVFTMTWQSDRQRFKCRARKQPERAAGIVCIEGDAPAREPLREAFVVTPIREDLSAQVDALVDAITGM